MQYALGGVITCFLTFILINNFLCKLNMGEQIDFTQRGRI